MTRHDCVVELQPSGELDLAAAPSLRAALGRALESGAAAVCVDLSAVTFLDSTGLNVFVDAVAAGARARDLVRADRSGGQRPTCLRHHQPRRPPRRQLTPLDTPDEPRSTPRRPVHGGSVRVRVEHDARQHAGRSLPARPRSGARSDPRAARTSRSEPRSAVARSTPRPACWLGAVGRTLVVTRRTWRVLVTNDDGERTEHCGHGGEPRRRVHRERVDPASGGAEFDRRDAQAVAGHDPPQRRARTAAVGIRRDHPGLVNGACAPPTRPARRRGGEPPHHRLRHARSRS